MLLRPRADLDRGHPCRDCAVSAAAVCTPLDARTLADFRNQGSRVDLMPGQPLFHQGDRASQVFSLTSGVMKLHAILADGRRQVIAFHYPGEFIGFCADREYHCTAEAVSPAVLCRFDTVRFERFSRKRGELARSHQHRLMSDLAAAQLRMVLLGRASARERLATFLHDVCQRSLGPSGLRRGSVIDLPMSRIDIADHLGLTQETVSRQFSALRRAGMIRTRPGRRLEICDPARVRALALDVRPDDPGR